MKLNIKEAIDFFDGRHPSDKGHASAIVGILGEDLNAAVFKHFLKRKNKSCRVKILSYPVTTGKKKGKRLDRWIYVKKANGKEILYQTEIKNWSSWAIGGIQLPLNANDDEILEATKHYWNRQKEKDFVRGEHPNGVTKVLVEMKPPDEYKNISQEPLIIYWMPLSDSEKNSIKPMFSINTSDVNPAIKTQFNHLNIFSISLYLRNLLKEEVEYLEFNLPNVEKRMKILKKIIS